MRIGIGLIGYGQIGRVHTYAYRALPLFYDPLPAEIELVGVCAHSEASAKKGREQGGYLFSCTDYHKLIERDDIDLVDVCSPNWQHAEAVMEALKAGKHVYCEKPLALDLKQAEEIVGLAKRSPGKTQIVSEYRFLPAIMRAKEMVQRSFLGRLFHFRGVYLHSGYIDTRRPISWRLQRSLAGGGALFDIGPHILDLMVHLVGMPSRICATTSTFVKRRPTEMGAKDYTMVDVDDATIMLLSFRGGGLGSVEVSRFATGSEDDLRFEICGSRGAISFNLMDPNWLQAFDNRGKEPSGFRRLATVQKYPPPAVLPPPKSSIGWIRSHVASQYGLINSIATDTEPSPNFEDALKVHMIMDAAYRSASTDGWMDIDPSAK